MKVRVTYNAPEIAIDETFAGANAQEIVAAMKRMVASQAGFAVRFVINAMSPTQFAQEVARRYCEATGKSLKVPADSAEFLKLAEDEGIARVIEP